MQHHGATTTISGVMMIRIAALLLSLAAPSLAQASIQKSLWNTGPVNHRLDAWANGTAGSSQWMIIQTPSAWIGSNPNIVNQQIICLSSSIRRPVFRGHACDGTPWNFYMETDVCVPGFRVNILLPATLVPYTVHAQGLVWTTAPCGFSIQPSNVVTLQVAT